MDPLLQPSTVSKLCLHNVNEKSRFGHVPKNRAAVLTLQTWICRIEIHRKNRQTKGWKCGCALETKRPDRKFAGGRVREIIKLAMLLPDTAVYLRTFYVCMLYSWSVRCPDNRSCCWLVLAVRASATWQHRASSPDMAPLCGNIEFTRTHSWGTQFEKWFSTRRGIWQLD